MLVTILVFEIIQTILVILIYPIVAYSVDKNTDIKLQAGDEKSVNFDSRLFMAEGRIDNLERKMRTPEHVPVSPVSSMPDGIVMRGERPEKKGTGGGIPRS